MSKKNFFQIVHYLGITILGIISIVLPLIYIKYIAWIPLAVVFSWIIFNGRIIDNLYKGNINIGTKLTDDITPILELFNKTLANYIFEKYLKNTNRPAYISFSIIMLFMSIMCYRLIFNIDFIKLQSKQV
jgi:hypothetical protein